MSVTASMYVPGVRPTVGSVSDPGRTRNINEDSFWIAPETLDLQVVAAKGWLFIVADGMGGYQGGEVASAIAVRSASDTYYAEPAETVGVDIEELLRQAVQQAQKAILDSQVQNPNHSQMGSTLVMSVIHGEQLFVANLGDSRCYRLRDGKLEQLTRDHSWVAEQARNGLITAEEARRSSNRNLLTRALGQASSSVKPDVDQYDWRSGDRLLMCCDGLWNMVPEADILKLLSNPNAQEAAADLVRAANAAGGPDNVTALIIGDLPPGHLPPEAPATVTAARQDTTDHLPVMTLPRRRVPAIRLLAAAIVMLIIVAAAGYVVLGQLNSAPGTPAPTAGEWATVKSFADATTDSQPTAKASETALTSNAPNTQSTQTFSQVLAASTVIPTASPTAAVLATTTPIPQLAAGDCVTRPVTTTDWQWSKVAVGVKETQGGIEVWGVADIATKMELTSYFGVPELHVPFTLRVIAQGTQPKSTDMRLCFQDNVDSSTCLNTIKGAQNLAPLASQPDTWLFDFTVADQPPLPQLRLISLADRSQPLTILRVAYCAR